ncbi:MAG: PIN domain-containing protein [Coriobacteriia bacterium]|nr:PIN domain-containing protein [Coriobacteriia bacterium]
MRILIDTNVVLDVLLSRAQHIRDSASVLSKIRSGEADGYLAAHTVTTIYYLACKRIGDQKTREFLEELVKFFRIARVDEYVIESALASPFADFEDAVVHEAGDASDVLAIVTRDKAGFAQATIPVFSPDEMLATLAKTTA